MKLYDMGITLIIIICITIIIGVTAVDFLGNNNPIANLMEEVAEDAIEIETGHKIDLEFDEEDKKDTFNFTLKNF